MERKSILQSRQIELLKIMADSDAHASKCVKMGLPFQDTYPEEYNAYIKARDEYNRNEEELANLPEEDEQI